MKQALKKPGPGHRDRTDTFEPEKEERTPSEGETCAPHTLFSISPKNLKKNPKVLFIKSGLIF